MLHKTESDRRRLAELYSSYNDEALMDLADSELTEFARTILLDEIDGRGLHDKLQAQSMQETDEVEPGRIIVWSGGSIEEASVIAHILSMEGIEVSVVSDAHSSQRSRVSVASHDGKAALERVARGLT